MYSTGPIAAKGAFTGDFGISPQAPAHQIPGEIERDREIMVRRPGMRQKHVPVLIDPATGEVFCGGRYLFDTHRDAEAYREWVVNEFEVDGVPFPERPYFVDPVFLAWQVIAAEETEGLDAHVAIRFERWALPEEVGEVALEALWPEARAEAARRGLAGVWLLYARDRREAGLVTIAGRTGPADPERPDEAALAALHAPSLGAALEGRHGAEKVFDRAGLVWTIWTPRAPAGEAPSLWPNSPPLPAPVPAAV